MAVPSTGHTMLTPGGWVWKQRPQEAGQDGAFDKVAAVISVRLPLGSSIPAVFVRGRRLAAADFPDCRIPAGVFYCEGPRIRSENFEHATFDVSWIGNKDGEGISPPSVNLLVEGLGDASLCLRGVDIEETERTISLPESTAAGDVWADSAFLPAGAPEVNSATGEKQKTNLYVNQVTRVYTGTIIGAGILAPQRWRCNAPRIDVDSNLIDLAAATPSAGALLIRVATWWPEVSTDSTGWKKESVKTSVRRQLGAVLACDFEARFRYQPRWDFP